jgi:hypothetical protein
MNNYTYTPAETLYYGNALFSLLSNGILRQVFKEYPFTTEGVRQAQTDLMSEKNTGKVASSYHYDFVEGVNFVPEIHCIHAKTGYPAAVKVIGDQF